MSSNYSANQYESSFRHNSWGEVKHLKEKPRAKTGHTTVIANDRGHLLPGVVKRGSAWPDFKGTWDLPSRIPACHINPTGRSVEGLNRLRSWGLDPQHTGTFQLHRSSKKSEKLQDANSKQTNRDVQQDCATPSATVEPRSTSQNCPIPGGEATTNQNQDSQAPVAGPFIPSDEDKQPAPGGEGLGSQYCAAEENPAPGEETNMGLQNGRGRPVSNVLGRAARPGTGASCI